MSIKGRSLELYFIDGKPDGMVTAMVPFQWTGHVLMTSRNQIGEALKREEAKRTGVYLLFGETEDGPLAYIGEGEDISLRIKTHDVKKDWWTSAVLITDTGAELNKAHVKYLEARLVQKALEVGKTALENGNSPSVPSLSEAQKNNMEGFLENIFTVLPALRIDSFLSDKRPLKTTKNTDEATSHAEEGGDTPPTFVLKTRRHGVEAEAILEKGEFIVLRGSKGRKEWGGSLGHNYRKLFNTLISNGVLEVQGDFAVFTENYAFNSPSAAGAMINGRATNGRTEWKHKTTGQTYHDWEQSVLNVEEGE